MNIAIYLQNDVTSFRIKEEHICSLKTSFPHWYFHNSTTENEFLEHLRYCDLCITWKFKKQWYDLSPSLKAVFTPAAGQEDIERNFSRTIPIHFGTFHGPIIAESLLAMMLYFSRKIRDLSSNQTKHLWDRNLLSNTPRLGSSKIALIGYGSIARECARILKVLGCRIIGIKHSPYDPLLDKDADRICHPEGLQNILCECDHIVTILPGTEKNRHFISREIFASIKKGACFYNIGRGNCYRDDDLLWALDQKIIAGAGLDVFLEEPLPPDSQLWNRPEIFIMPHASAINSEYLPLYIQELTGHLKAFL